MMQAVIMNRFGGADVLHLAERPKPEPKPGEVLIRTRCVGVNYIDALTRAGKGVPVESFPAIVGWDLAGAVAGRHPVPRRGRGLRHASLPSPRGGLR
jgi:NADPH:quinone reductase-like Zn-dependent oxidoreductase